jgi:DNA polymerase IV
VGLQSRIERDLGLTASVGLSHNKFLAKIASDMDKPRGFSVIGQAETQGFLAGLPVRAIWGVGTATQAALEAAGIRGISDLLRWDRADLVARFGSMGDRLYHLARGQDRRRVEPDGMPRSISKETTFHDDTADPDLLEGHLWRLAEQVADRAKAKGLAGRTVVLKLKRTDFGLVTRRVSLAEPTQTTDRIWRAARAMFAALPGGVAYRLIGVGLSDISGLSDIAAGAGADMAGDLLDPDAGRRAAAERATDAIRARFGPDAIIRGRALR